MIKTLRFINENKSIILILIVAIILRLYHLDFQSAWMDEIYTLNVSNPNSSFSTLINEAAYRMGFIDKAQLKALAEPLLKSGYGNHLLSILEE